MEIRFCCKKSGYFTKPVKNITNGIFICRKQVNNDTKSKSYSLKKQQNYFCNGTYFWWRESFINKTYPLKKQNRERGRSII